jgi:hypothetical protein
MQQSSRGAEEEHASTSSSTGPADDATTLVTRFLWWPTALTAVRSRYLHRVNYSGDLGPIRRNTLSRSKIVLKFPWGEKSS